MRLNDLTGKKYNMLEVIKRVPNNNLNKAMWLCKCDCGKTKEIIGSRLYTGKTKSCGCLTVEKTIQRSTKHGLSHSRLDSIYQNMLSRCTNSSNKDFKYYGARGINIYDEWLNDRAAFFMWVISNGYSDKLTIDRIDNDGNYEPSNCRWVDMKTQAINRRARSEHIA